jgi:hypothetical protein
MAGEWLEEKRVVTPLEIMVTLKSTAQICKLAQVLIGRDKQRFAFANFSGEASPTG